ncbi:MAG: HNH endonuclease signature motif containing protein [Bellilinea sp.]
MITQKRLKELLHYNPETGAFAWKSDRYAGRNNAFLITKAGDRAGFVVRDGYRYIVIDGNRKAEHRWAWLYMTGVALDRSTDIDHINGVRGDNKWRNLRTATRSENMQNMKTHHLDNETGFLGVERKRDKFSARICLKGVRHSLGSFDTAQAAHEEYLKAKRVLHNRGTL